MRPFARRDRRFTAVWALLLALASTLAACGGATNGGADTTGSAQPDAGGSTAAVASSSDDGADTDGSTSADTGFDFATGPAVTVAADYAYPEDRVDSTGAYLPINGKPTVVYVDAIW